MPGTQSISLSVDELLEAGCARNVPAELHYEDARGMVSVARARLLGVEGKEILADRPLYLEDNAEIPPGKPITVHVLVNGTRYQFTSAITAVNRFVRLNARQVVPGIALRKPKTVAPSQRRANLRISLANYDPISVVLVHPHPDIPDACWIDAHALSAWLIDLSGGGTSVLVDRMILGRVRRGEQFYLTFFLPLDGGWFNMLGTVRQCRTVEVSNSLRIGFNFRPWPGSNFAQDQQRVSRFVAAFERRILRRRK